jgi:hypothetical protein
MITSTKTDSFDPSKLILPKDFKADPKNLEWMISSVRDEGLLHPPLIKDNLEVFAGKLRVVACRANNLTEILCRVYPSNLPDEEYRILSLHENLKRYNLPWYEQVAKEKELHELRQAAAGAGKKGKKVGWSLRDTAEELNMSFGVLSEDIRMADAIVSDPSLRRIQDKSTARRVILEGIKRSNQELGASAPAKVELNVCHLGGSESILRMYPDNTFDVCLTDPPWLEFKDASLTRDAFTLPVFKEVFRVLQANSFLYAFVSTQDWLFYQENLAKIGFSVQKWPLIWVKEGVLSYGSRSWEHQRDYEPIILAVKGSPALVNRMCSSVMSCKVVPSGKLTHPNEKPKEIIKRLLELCTYDGSVVLDPFAGSFVVPKVCKEMRRRYVAIEKDQDYYSKGVDKLK